MKRFFLGLLVIPSIALLGGLLGSSSVSAASSFDDYLITTNELWTGGGVCSAENVTGIENELFNDSTYWSFGGEESKRTEYATAIDSAINSGSYIIVNQDTRQFNSDAIISIYYSKSGIYLDWQTDAVYVRDVLGDPLYVVDFQVSSSWNCELRSWQAERSMSKSIGHPGNTHLKVYKSSNNFDENYPLDYGGEELPGESGGATNSDWKPDIKLHRGSNWEVELSDYNFFTIDKVPFTCGDDELAPVINWEVWDITDDQNRVLIDTLIFGAPSVVTYNAPKIQDDKKYELVAWYSDCEGVNFTSASTRQFTVKKDGNLKSTDLAAVCIIAEAPFINIPNCIGDVNDMLATLAFRTPKAGDVGGGGFLTLVNGCRELQVLDDWMMSPGTTVCPKMPEHVRSTITPIIVFGLALLGVGLLSRRAGGSTI